jgi:hypothetical protein
MQLSADPILSACSRDDRRFKPEFSQLRYPLEICFKPKFRLRGLAWSLFLSTILWVSFILAGRALWSWWR